MASKQLQSNPNVKRPSLFQRMFRWNSLANQAFRTQLPMFFQGLGYGYYGQRNLKHDIDHDFGYPKEITPRMLWSTYERNPLAHAAVNRTVGKCFETFPKLESDMSEENETPQEKLVRAHLRKIKFWQGCAEADRRGAVQGYGGLILILGDDMSLTDPVEPGYARTRGGIESIVEVIPAWSEQLFVSRFNTDRWSMDYGKPAMFTYHEANVLDHDGASQRLPRSFEIHPDRVLIFSKDGTVHAESILKAGFNSLLDAEKVVGAGGEGFWRNARHAPFFEVEPAQTDGDVVRGLGVQGLTEIQGAMNERVSDWLAGFSNYLMIKGVKPHFPNVSLPSPEYYFKNVAEMFAASVEIPFRVLLGNETGERASSEDSKAWTRTCMSRRENVLLPVFDDLIMRLQMWEAIDDSEWMIAWDDLGESTDSEKADLVTKMVNANRASIAGTGELVFTSDEIRAAYGLEPLADDERIAPAMEDPQMSAIAMSGGTESGQSGNAN